MTARIHRVLVALSALLVGLASFVNLTEASTLGVDPQVWAGFGLAGAVTALLATFWREATDSSSA